MERNLLAAQGWPQKSASASTPAGIGHHGSRSAQGAACFHAPAGSIAMVGWVSDMELEPISVRVLPHESAAGLAVRNEARTAVMAAAGGVLAGAATVAAVRAVTAVAARKRAPRRLSRRERPNNVVASRSFLVDVHLLGR